MWLSVWVESLELSSERRSITNIFPVAKLSITYQWLLELEAIPTPFAWILHEESLYTDMVIVSGSGAEQHERNKDMMRALPGLLLVAMGRWMTGTWAAAEWWPAAKAAPPCSSPLPVLSEPMINFMCCSRRPNSGELIGLWGSEIATRFNNKLLGGHMHGKTPN